MRVISGGSRISLRWGRHLSRGRQHTILPNFPKTAWNWKNLDPRHWLWWSFLFFLMHFVVWRHSKHFFVSRVRWIFSMQNITIRTNMMRKWKNLIDLWAAVQSLLYSLCCFLQTLHSTSMQYCQLSFGCEFKINKTNENPQAWKVIPFINWHLISHLLTSYGPNNERKSKYMGIQSCQLCQYCNNSLFKHFGASEY